MARTTYSDETKAAVLSALMAGQMVSKVAKEYGIPSGTVRRWKSNEIAAQDPQTVAVRTQKKAALGDLILGLLEEELITLQAIARFVRDPEWLSQQAAADVAVLSGVMQDKVFRKIEALNKNAESED